MQCKAKQSKEMPMQFNLETLEIAGQTELQDKSDQRYVRTSCQYLHKETVSISRFIRKYEPDSLRV